MEETTPTVPPAPAYRDGTLTGGTAAFIQLLILAAGGISAYLLSLSINGGQAVGCGVGSSCDEVLKSNWAYLLGIPVSAFALAVDATLLVTTFFCDAKSKPAQRRVAWKILMPGSLFILAGALWFIAVQALILHHFCPWCMTAHVCGSLAAYKILRRAPLGGPMAENEPGLPRRTLVLFALLAMFAIAAMGVTQTLVQRKTFTVGNVTAMATADATTNAVAQNSQTNTPPAPIRSPLPVLGGRVVLDLDNAPVWGSPNAPLKLVSLFDYTCPHCRGMHPRLETLQQIFGDKLAIISLPVPLACECNSLFKKTRIQQTNACIYAHLGLTVWRAKPDAIKPFDDWMFAVYPPRPLTDVTNKVLELIGQDAFDKASRDPWVDQQMQTDISIYIISLKDFQNNDLPQFMIGTNIISGFLSVEELGGVVSKYDTNYSINRL